MDWYGSLWSCVDRQSISGHWKGVDAMDFWWMSMECCCWIAVDLDGNVLRLLLMLWVCTWILIDADGQCFKGPAGTQLDCNG